MKKVYKWSLPKGKDRFSLEIPQGAMLLTAHVQHGSPVIWALIDPEAPAEKRDFIVLETGEQLPELPGIPHYIATFQFDAGNYILHLFEITHD